MIDEAPDLEPLRILKDTYAPFDKFHPDYLNRLADYVQWCDEHAPTANPWSEHMLYKFLIAVNEKQKAATYAKRVVAAFNFFTFRAEILDDPKRITKKEYIKAQVQKCSARKEKKREAEPLSMEMVGVLEELVFDKTRCPEERESWGFVRFITGTRFRAFDAARIPNEPVLEGECDQGLVFVETRSELTKNGQRPERRGKTLQVVAHTKGVSGLLWGKEWLALRKQLKMAETFDVLHPNIDGQWKPIKGTTMPSEKVTSLIRMFLVNEMGLTNQEAAKYSSHSCKPTFLTVLAKRGVLEDIRRVLGYHASGRQQMVELYARTAWSHPMRVLAAVLKEIRAKKFRPDESHSRRYADDYDPFGSLNMEMPFVKGIPKLEEAGATTGREAQEERKEDDEVEKRQGSLSETMEGLEAEDDAKEDLDDLRRRAAHSQVAARVLKGIEAERLARDNTLAMRAFPRVRTQKAQGKPEGEQYPMGVTMVEWDGSQKSPGPPPPPRYHVPPEEDSNDNPETGTSAAAVRQWLENQNQSYEGEGDDLAEQLGLSNLGQEARQASREEDAKEEDDAMSEGTDEEVYAGLVKDDWGDDDRYTILQLSKPEPPQLVVELENGQIHIGSKLYEHGASTTPLCKAVTSTVTRSRTGAYRPMPFNTRVTCPRCLKHGQDELEEPDYVTDEMW